MNGLRSLASALALAAIAAHVGCGGRSGSSAGTSDGGTGDGPGSFVTNCTADPSVNCPGGAGGFTCPAGQSSSSAPDLVCSSPVHAADGTSSYCCLPSQCQSCSLCSLDDAVACPTGSTGLTCDQGVDPSSVDSSLSCDAPTPDVHGGADYCCTTGDGGSTGAGAPAGCITTSAVTCTGSAMGYACNAGASPENVGGLACTVPVQSGKELDYCCFQGAGELSASSCQAVDLPGSCASGTYSLQCAAGVNPSQIDPALTCAAGFADPDGVHEDYCCTR